MTISAAIGIHFFYALDAAGVLTRTKLRDFDSVEVMPGPAGASMIQLATSDESLFVLTANGKVWRRQEYAEVWHQLLNVPLGVTYMQTTQHALQMVHGSGSLISAIKLKSDGRPHVTDTQGVTTIAEVHGDERLRTILLDDGTLYAQKYSNGTLDLLQTPGPVDSVEVAHTYIYYVVGGQLYRVHDYENGSPDLLAGTGIVAFPVVSSDHVDHVYYVNTDGTTGQATPGSWQGTGVSAFDDGWVWGVGNSVGQTAWTSGDWVDVALG